MTPPDDPFSLKPVRYKFANNRATLYSIGDDLVDNGGYESDWDASPDIAVTIASSDTSD